MGVWGLRWVIKMGRLGKWEMIENKGLSFGVWRNEGFKWEASERENDGLRWGIKMGSLGEDASSSTLLEIQTHF